jgi:hypothetical protein
MKLFVIGQISSDPDEWDSLLGLQLILADSREQAETMTDYGSAIEVAIERPAVLTPYLPGPSF